MDVFHRAIHRALQRVVASEWIIRAVRLAHYIDLLHSLLSLLLILAATTHFLLLVQFFRVTHSGNGSLFRYNTRLDLPWLILLLSHWSNFFLLFMRALKSLIILPLRDTDLLKRLFGVLANTFTHHFLFIFYIHIFVTNWNTSHD